MPEVAVTGPILVKGTYGAVQHLEIIQIRPARDVSGPHLHNCTRGHRKKPVPFVCVKDTETYSDTPEIRVIL